MQNPKLVAILREAVQEERQYKVCLIEDIIKAKKTLWTFGQKQHNEFLLEETAVKLFDHLHDLDIPALELINNDYGKKINELLTTRLKAVNCGLED